MISKEDCIKLYNTAWQILRENTPADIDLDKYFVPPKSETINDVMDIMFSTLQDYQSMPKSIKYNERREIFKSILCDFDALEILKKYGNEVPENPEENLLLKEFVNAFNLNINIYDNHNLWVKYSKSVISACIFMSHFQNLEEFRTFVKKFENDELVNLALVLLLEHEIFGMGFALACNFLKDVGYTDFSKPDVHIKDVLCGLGFCKDNDFEIIRTIKKIAEANKDETPFKIDRLIWLVCSGNYFLDNLPKRYPAKQQLIDEMKNKI